MHMAGTPTFFSGGSAVKSMCTKFTKYTRPDPVHLIRGPDFFSGGGSAVKSMCTKFTKYTASSPEPAA